jgi:SEC-C motif-containing protein
MPSSASCPCGGGQDYTGCCGRWHAGEPAPDALALMRSRYSAYVLGLHPYLLATWHPSTRPAAIELDPPGLKWLGLQIKRHAELDRQHAVVDFVARSKLGGRAHRLHESSRFVHEDRWYYVDGDQH